MRACVMSKKQNLNRAFWSKNQSKNAKYANDLKAWSSRAKMKGRMEGECHSRVGSLQTTLDYLLRSWQPWEQSTRQFACEGRQWPARHWSEKVWKQQQKDPSERGEPKEEKDEIRNLESKNKVNKRKASHLPPVRWPQRRARRCTLWARQCWR